MKTRRLSKLTNSFVGRVVRRLLGEEKGVVMMEYIVIALLVVTAAVVAVVMFGRTITDMFGVTATAMTGDYRQARAQQNAAQTQQTEGVSIASSHAADTSSNKSKTDIGKQGY